jgi:membrane protein implicated in regulation of membrane protease activity
MTWWMWMAFGVLLAGIELAVPGGFYVIFFAVAALLVGLLAMVGLVSGPVAEWVAVSVLSVVALRFFRSPLLARLRTHEPIDLVDSIAGESAIASGDIGPGQYGQVELRGSIWRARNVAAGPLSAGQRCRVAAVNGLLLDVSPE